MHSKQFALTFVALFIITFGFLALVGATPDSSPKKPDIGNATALPKDSVGQEPVRIIAKTINLDTVVENPTSTDINALDQALLKGAVRYPTSGLLGVADQTILVFGHSSYLPIVHNQAYKTFDGIQNLKVGDIISVYSADKEYRYGVVGVKTATADEDQTLRISLPQDGTKLMLVTCDSFTKKTSRFVVTADFVGVYVLQ